MPWFTLHRNYSLSTTFGHIIGFKKGEATWVPPACVPSAVAIGAQPVVELKLDTDITDVLPPEEKEEIPLTPDQRREKYFAAFEKMVLRSERTDFTASGLPHLKKLEEITGLSVSQPERDAMWGKYNESKQETA
jgi:hypothetical protein